MDFGSASTGSVDEPPICQNLIDPSSDAEMREEGEENVRDLMRLVWPMRVLKG